MHVIILRTAYLVIMNPSVYMTVAQALRREGSPKKKTVSLHKRRNVHCVPQFAALGVAGAVPGGSVSHTCRPQNHPAPSAGAGGSLTAALAKGRRRNPG